MTATATCTADARRPIMLGEAPSLGYVTLTEAHALGYPTPTTLRAHIDTGYLTSVRAADGRTHLVLLTDLERLERRRPVPAAETSDEAAPSIDELFRSIVAAFSRLSPAQRAVLGELAAGA